MSQMNLPPSPIFWVEMPKDGVPILWYQEYNIEVAVVLSAYRQGETFKMLCAHFDTLPPDLIAQTLAYYHAHQDILDAYLDEIDRLLAWYRSQTPISPVQQRVEAYKLLHGIA